MELFHNRHLLEYTGMILPHLLLRRDGADIRGQGADYFSVVDDTAIEILKCLWLDKEQFLHDPAPRRIQYCTYIDAEEYKKRMWQITENMIAALDKLESIKDSSDTLYFMNLERGLFLILAAQIKPWKKAYFKTGFQKALDPLNYWILRNPDRYGSLIDNVTLLNLPDDQFEPASIPEPCIIISDRILPGYGEEISGNKLIMYDGRYYN